jgi:hypothetical protein
MRHHIHAPFHWFAEHRLTLVVVAALTLMLAISEGTAAASYADTSVSEIQSKVREFIDSATGLYRLDQDDMTQIWDAYCGVFDPDNPEDAAFAADIGKQLQESESEKRDELLNQLPDLKNLVSLGKQDSKATADEKDALGRAEDDLKKQEGFLKDLADGVVLKGSNHPFVQTAVAYGQAQHLEMCDEYGDSDKPKLCDVPFANMDNRRPDLIAFEGTRMVIYEFKPDNQRAKDRGLEQLETYAPYVQDFFEKYFVSGPNKGYTGVPDDKYQGQKMLDAIKAAKDSWHDTDLQVDTKLATYNMCDNPFD